jgi:hypothetical protein
MLLSSDNVTVSADHVIAVLTLFITLITGVYAWVTYEILRSSRDQSRIQAQALAVQNKLLHSQILAQRFEMYWKTFSPISQEEIDQAALIPEDWMNPEEFWRKYHQDKSGLRRHMALVKCYEYLALMRSMRQLKLPDPLGYHWGDLWVKDLSSHPEFLQINDWYRVYYPDFASFVDSLQAHKPAQGQSETGDD